MTGRAWIWILAKKTNIESTYTKFRYFFFTLIISPYDIITQTTSFPTFCECSFLALLMRGMGRPPEENDHMIKFIMNAAIHNRSASDRWMLLSKPHWLIPQWNYDKCTFAFLRNILRSGEFKVQIHGRRVKAHLSQTHFFITTPKFDVTMQRDHSSILTYSFYKDVTKTIVLNYKKPQKKVLKPVRYRHIHVHYLTDEISLYKLLKTLRISIFIP